MWDFLYSNECFKLESLFYSNPYTKAEYNISSLSYQKPHVDRKRNSWNRKPKLL